LSKIILVRHGRTAWHAEGRYAGTADVPLDEVGRAQVARVVERLSGVNFAAIYTSPLSRCHELAVEVAKEHGMEAISDARLGEIDFGRWDGETFQNIIEKDGDILKRWTEDPTSITIPGGESLLSVQDIISAVLGLPLAHLFRLTVDLASVTTINYKGMFSNLEEMNDRCHLTGLDATAWL
jgi:broad specificity phosphatase PhoE